MVLQPNPSAFWAEPRLLLSPSDAVKAARIGGMVFDELNLVDCWQRRLSAPVLCADLDAAAAFGLHLLLAQVDYEDLFTFPSPFMTDDSF